MKQRYLFLLVITLFCAFVCRPVLAQDVKELEKQFNSELRSAQSAMFNGKLDVADAGVKKCGELIESLKKLYPQHKQLSAFEQKLGKLQGDLAKKTNKVPADAAKVMNKTPTPQAAASSKAKALPRKTAQEMRELTKTLDSLEKYEKDRMLRIQEDYSPYSIESTFDSIQQKIDSLPGLLEKVAAVAAEDAASEHPDFIAVKERVTSVSSWAGAELAKTRASVEKQKSGETAAGEAAGSLKALWDEYDNKYFTPINNLSYENEIAKIAEAFTLLSEYSGKKAEITRTLTDFEAKYGNDRDAIEKATGGMEAVYPWENFKKAMTDIESVPARIGEKVKGMIDQELSSLSSRHDFYRLERHAEIKKLEEFCTKNVPGYTPDAGIASKLAEDAKLFEAKIDQRSWPACKGNDTDRAGALDYLKNSWGKDDKHKYNVLGTVITGEWSVQKKDLLGQPIMYGLPVLLAVQKPEDQAHGLARVFILTMRTPEGAGAKMAPPFSSDTVGDSYYIRASQIK
ncbi:MAG: hypothetical protein A2W80_03195 [Candidatus Riflebacteria bacterium GWC2_50_8]|nr:MAG: hypothetical protein A2W80_03195 [Candidatus Riflebacteria bacterium GWC2_50_8]